MIPLAIPLLFMLFIVTNGFWASLHYSYNRNYEKRDLKIPCTARNLYKLDWIDALGKHEYAYPQIANLTIGLVTENDLTLIARFLTDIFYCPDSFMKEIWRLESVANPYLKNPITKISRAIQGIDKRYDFQLRCYAQSFAIGRRLWSPSLTKSMDRIALALVNNTDDNTMIYDNIVGYVELSLQPVSRIAINDLSVTEILEKAIGRLLPLKPDRYHPHLSCLCINPKYRCNGYGKLLVKVCEHIAAEYWGYDKLYLNVERSNTLAKKMYESLGYNYICDVDNEILFYSKVII